MYLKPYNTFENLLNEISKIIYSLYWAKEISKNVYNKIMNSIKLQNRMDTILMNSGNSKTSVPCRPLLNLSEKIIFKKTDRYVALSSISTYYTWKNIKKSWKNTKFKISASTWNEHGEKTDDLSIRIYVNKIENGAIFKTKAGYYLELLTP